MCGRLSRHVTHKKKQTPHAGATQVEFGAASLSQDEKAGALSFTCNLPQVPPEDEETAPDAHEDTACVLVEMVARLWASTGAAPEDDSVKALMGLVLQGFSGSRASAPPRRVDDVFERYKSARGGQLLLKGPAQPLAGDESPCAAGKSNARAQDQADDHSEDDGSAGSAGKDSASDVEDQEEQGVNEVGSGDAAGNDLDMNPAPQSPDENVPHSPPAVHTSQAATPRKQRGQQLLTQSLRVVNDSGKQ